MARTRITLFTTLCLGLGATAGLAQTVTLELPSGTRTAATVVQALTTYSLPIAAFSDGQMHTRQIEGPMTQTVWAINAPGRTTLQLLSPLRAQLVQAGFQIVFVCESAECGGFDFRYGTAVLPEPDMHVDLGDYRFLSATKGDAAVTLMVSRSSSTGFVQMTQVAAVGESARPEKPSALAGQVSGEMRIAAFAASDQLGAGLMAGASVAMDDLAFATGASALSEGVYPSLVALAD